MNGWKQDGWKQVWLLVSLVWVATAAFYASHVHDVEAQRLHLWADAIEGVINGDPMVAVSAKELRSKVGDEEFIGAAAAAYPQVDLRSVMRRYQQDMADHPPHEHLVATFALWALVPPLALGLLAFLAEWTTKLVRLSARRRRP